MGVRKVYQSIHFKDLDTYVAVEGVKTLIQFRGGSLKPDIKGTYATSDPRVIKAMDKDSGNGTSFRCVHVDNFVDLDKEEEEVTASPVDGMNIPNEPPEDEPPEGDAELTPLPGYSTVQAARTYMSETYGIPLSKMPNGAAVKKQAAEKKIVFVDLR